MIVEKKLEEHRQNHYKKYKVLGFSRLYAPARELIWPESIEDFWKTLPRETYLYYEGLWNIIDQAGVVECLTSPIEYVRRCKKYLLNHR